MDDYIDVKIDVFEHTGQRARVRKSLTINALIEEVLREFDDIAGDTPEKYAIYPKGFDNPFKPHETLTELDIQPQDELVFDYMRQAIRRMLDVEHYATLREDSTGKEFDIQWQPAVIGRPSKIDVDHDNILAVNVQLLPNGITVSRRHAQITFSEGRYFIEPLAEQNPVFLNGKELPFQTKREIRNGDKLSFGNKKLTMTFFKQIQRVSQTITAVSILQSGSQPVPTATSIPIQPSLPAPTDVNGTILSSKTPTAALVIEESSSLDTVGNHIKLTGFPFTLGRVLTSLNSEEEVSRKHAEVNYDKQSSLFTITDLQSTNGVTLNGVKITPDVPHVISPDMRIGLGSVLVLRLETG
jgi:pSer/pThr/pTyr-binding forkhead associated (FHA) protein